MADDYPLLYGSIETAKRVGISLRQLYYWVSVLRAVSPTRHRHGRRQFQYFTPRDLKILRDVKQRMARGYTLRAAVKASRLS